MAASTSRHQINQQRIKDHYPVDRFKGRGWNKVFLKKIQILIHFLRQRKIANGQQLCIVVCSKKKTSKLIEKQICKTGYGTDVLQRYVPKYHAIIKERLETKLSNVLILSVRDFSYDNEAESLLKGKGDFIIEWDDNDDGRWGERDLKAYYIKKMMNPHGYLASFTQILLDESKCNLTFVILQLNLTEGVIKPQTIQIVQAWIRKCVESGSWIKSCIGSDVEEVIAEYNEVILMEWETYQQVSQRAKKN